MAGNATIGALKVSLGLDSAQFTDGLTAAQKHLRDVGESMQALSSRLTRIGAGLSAAITAPIVAIGVASLSAASDAKEMQSAFNYVFGSMAKDVEAWAQTTGDALGRSTFALQEQALAFQQLFKQAAPTQAAAADLSKQFTLLAQDLASFYNTTESEALTKLRSALTGEAEPIRDFGVFLNEAAVSAKALELGLAGSAKALTEQDRILARAALVLEATKDAQGDAARTADGFANKTKALNAALDEAGKTIGSVFIPVATQITTALTSALNAVNNMSPTLQAFVIGIGGVAVAAGPVTLALGAMISAVGTLSTALAGAGLTIAALAGPLGILAAAIGVVTVALLANSIEAAKLREANRKLIETQGGAKEVLDKYEEAARLAATATGDAKKAALDHANALRVEAAEAVKAAKALREKALAAAEAAERSAAEARNNADPRTMAGFAAAWAGAGSGMWGATSPAAEVAAHTDKVATRARERLKAATEAAAAAEARYAKILEGDTIPAIVDSGIAAETSLGEAGKAANGAAKEVKSFDERLAEVIERLQTDSERAARQAAADIDILRQAFDRGKISAAEFHEQLLRMREERPSNAPLMGAGENLKRPWEDASEALEAATEEQERAWDQSLERMGVSFRGFFQGWVANGKADWKRLLLDLTSDWQNTMNVLARMTGGLGATLKGALSGLGGAIAGLGIGNSLGFGTGNRTADLGLSIGGSIAGGLLASSSFAGTIGAGIANGLAGMGASTAIAGGLGTMLTSAAVLGPVAAIAALALGSVFKGKPTNAGAGYDLVTGQLSGDKRTADTEKAVTAAADAIRQGQEMLKAAGVTLGATVNGLVIGTRDLSQIYLSNGRTLTSAVGDSAAAVETALKGVLDGATFASEAQESLVRSMLAAGKGFDEIAAALSAFGEAQKLPQAIADAIQQLQDPAGFDVEQLKREQEARRKSIQAQVDAGYLTAEQFASLTDQLRILEGLELDKAMGRLVGQIDAATASSDAVASARDVLRTAYERESSELDTVISRLKSLGANLRSFGQSLTTGPLAMLSPKARYEATRAEFERVRQAALRGDEDALAKLPDVAQAFLEASQEFNAATPAYFADLSAVKSAVSATASLADGLADGAEAELEALNKQVAGQIELNKNVISVKDAIVDLGKALAFFSSSRGQNLGANPSVNAALATATGYAGDFGTGGWQAWIVQQSEQIKAVARQILTAFGQPERISGFATGGSFKVGGSGGIDSQLVQFRASPDETVTITKPGQVSDSLTEVAVLRRIEARVGAVESGVQALFNQAGAAANRAYDQGERQIGQLQTQTRALRTAAAR